LNTREKLELAAVWTLVHLLGLPPREMARPIGAWIGAAAFRVLPRLRSVGRQNLKLAYPQMSAAEQDKVLRGVYKHLGWQMAEFCQMRRYTPENTRGFLRYEGLENYLAAKEEGKGVFVLTGHLGAWELSSFYHSLMGYPMSMVIRRLDNPGVDRLVNEIRCMHGNKVLHKDDFARGLLAAMRRGETVGILMDTNMTPPQGVFVDFFGHMACTAAGMARVAQKTGAAVLPGFVLWEPAEKKYVLHFGKRIDLVDTGDAEADMLTNTAIFAKVTEEYVRRYPDQWLWVHRRWKTRPAGEPPIYTS
jgi:Kdo2-lipid IVA lauroyltransferase/acyltransferase